jgi:hypothetical protein
LPIRRLRAAAHSRRLEGRIVGGLHFCQNGLLLGRLAGK